MNPTISQNVATVNTVAAAPLRSRKPARPLTARVAEMVIEGKYAFCLEFQDRFDARVIETGGTVDVFGVYKEDDLTAPLYAVEVIGAQVVACNCPDAKHRKRICKHMVALAMELSCGIAAPELAPVLPAAYHAPVKMEPVTVKFETAPKLKPTLDISDWK